MTKITVQSVDSQPVRLEVSVSHTGNTNPTDVFAQSGNHLPT